MVSFLMSSSPSLEEGEFFIFDPLHVTNNLNTLESSHFHVCKKIFSDFKMSVSEVLLGSFFHVTSSCL